MLVRRMEGLAMSDDKPKSDEPTNVVSAALSEAGDFARKHGISLDSAQKLIDEHGHDAEKLAAAVAHMEILK